MTIQTSSLPRRSDPLVLLTWCLRVAVGLQALGVGAQRLGLLGFWEDESAVFTVLWLQWKWPVEAARRIDDAGAWAYFLCGLAVLLLPLGGAAVGRIPALRRCHWPAWAWQLPLCLAVAAWQTAVTVAEQHVGGFFMSQWTLVSESSRLAPPLALCMLAVMPRETPRTSWRIDSVLWLLRAAAALTFFGHGLKAYRLSPAFADYLFSFAELLGSSVEQTTVHAMLRAIGIVDIALALLILVTRSRSVAWYMFAWALIAALARVVQAGPTAHFEVLIRGGNYCVPLALGLFWHMTRHRPVPADVPTPGG